ncbi:MAG: DUF87 domain-containing protein [Nitrososphaerota archaeon]|nr:DUF87 domain-containing protein [Nitrososphaerota archaeon]
MPAVDIVQLIHSAVEKNREIPAMIDAYGEFVDSPIGPLELENLEAVFKQILDNLSQRYPDVASKRAATTARNDIESFLIASNNNVDRLKEVLRSELRNVADNFALSISERFSKMNGEEKRAIDASLRLIRRSLVELLFRVEQGKQLGSSGKEFQKYFAAIKAQAPGIKELRYENLIVEKAIFNKLLLKAKDRDYSIWVPSFFSKEKADALIKKLNIPSENLLLSRLRDLKSQDKIDPLRPALALLEENLGVVQKGQKIPQELSDFVQESGDYLVMAPHELDNISQFIREEEEEQRARQKEQEEMRRREKEAIQIAEERKSEQYRQKIRQVAVEVTVAEIARAKSGNAVYLGRQLDVQQMISALVRNVQEKDIPSQVKEIGEFYIELDVVKRDGVAIVGASGSGRSTTLKRLVDGIAGKSGAPKIIVIDQKGEHRGVAWKYSWKVFGFASDSQSQEFREALLTKDPESAELVSDLIQEWLLQSGQGCSTEQRARIASIIRAQTESQDLEDLWNQLSKEPELAQIAQKLKKGLSRSASARIFAQSATPLPANENTLFDVSGRGLRDPTTKEERQIITSLILRDLLSSDIRNSLIVVEDMLDRFKSESLKHRTIQLVSKLRAIGNSFVVTSRSQVREFLGADAVEFVHRLSGEKTINEEISGFKTEIQSQSLARAVVSLPRGYLVTSTISEPSGQKTPSAVVKVEPLQFVTTQR